MFFIVLFYLFSYCINIYREKTTSLRTLLNDIIIQDFQIHCDSKKNEFVYTARLLFLSEIQNQNYQAISQFQKFYNYDLILAVDNNFPSYNYEDLKRFFDFKILLLFHNINTELVTTYFNKSLICYIDKYDEKKLLGYSILKMNNDFKFEIYHTIYFFPSSTILLSSIIFLAISFILVIPKLLYFIYKYNDPFQQPMSVCIFIHVLLCVLLCCEAKTQLEFYKKHSRAITGNLLYTIILFIDNILKSYTLLIVIAIANGVLIRYNIPQDSCGVYFLIFIIIVLLFTTDIFIQPLRYSSKRQTVKLIIEMKELVLLTPLIQLSLKSIKKIQFDLGKEILFGSITRQEDRKAIKIKYKYLQNLKISLIIFLLHITVLSIILKSALINYMHGFVVLMARVLNDTVLMVLLSIVFCPKNLPRSFFKMNGYRGETYLMSEVKEISRIKESDIDDSPVVVISPIWGYEGYKVGYLEGALDKKNNVYDDFDFYI